eukprot:887752-Prymnesium_polylepis.1
MSWCRCRIATERRSAALGYRVYPLAYRADDGVARFPVACDCKSPSPLCETEALAQMNRHRDVVVGF